MLIKYPKEKKHERNILNIYASNLVNNYFSNFIFHNILTKSILLFKMKWVSELTFLKQVFSCSLANG